jgi:hypothetical protein
MVKDAVWREVTKEHTWIPKVPLVCYLWEAGLLTKEGVPKIPSPHTAIAQQSQGSPVVEVSLMWEEHYLVGFWKPTVGGTSTWCRLENYNLWLLANLEGHQWRNCCLICQRMWLGMGLTRRIQEGSPSHPSAFHLWGGCVTGHQQQGVCEAKVCVVPEVSMNICIVIFWVRTLCSLMVGYQPRSCRQLCYSEMLGILL